MLESLINDFHSKFFISSFNQIGGLYLHLIFRDLGD